MHGHHLLWSPKILFPERALSEEKKKPKKQKPKSQEQKRLKTESEQLPPNPSFTSLKKLLGQPPPGSSWASRPSPLCFFRQLMHV